MESENPIVAFHAFIASTLEQERAARSLLHSLRFGEPGDEQEVFQVARVLAIAAWTHDAVPDILSVQKLRHELRDVVQQIAEYGACLDRETESQVVQEIDTIVAGFNAACARAEEK